MTRHGRKTRIALKYCGSCNPLVDLTRVARQVAKLAEQRRDLFLVPVSEEGIDIVVILCGCHRACGNKEEVRARANQSLVIAGESLDGRPVPEKCLTVAIEQALVKTLELHRSSGAKD